ncbi:methyltransferase domain-containing protein [Rhodospirillaceae bacterium AH-315-P19]|nr:methyltransferase domain-containing protein [Rhodospirillaceae bacterium AH-315-P19]
MSPFPNSRQCAIELLGAVLARKTPLEEGFANHGGIAGLEPRDRAFVRNLVGTTLRHLGEINTLIDHALEKPLPHKAAPVQHLLQIGITQLCFLDTPPHAAVDQSVALLHATPLASYKGLVNAVLRRLTREGKGLLDSLDAPRLNTPAWLWKSWECAYGKTTCRAIANAHLQEAPLDLTFRKGMEDQAEALGATSLPTGSFRLYTHGRVDALAGYAEGSWWVQDGAAAIPAKLLGDVHGTTVLDLCAAPGGKAAQLADRGAHVLAVDRSRSRLRRVHENFSRLHLSIETIAADATAWRPKNPAAFVLLDPPCSGTGTLRRHPDIAWQKTPDDVKKLCALQARLLKAAAAMTAPGGLLVYAVCSLEQQEGVEQIDALLAGGAPFTRVPIAAGEVGDRSELLTPQGDLRTLPSHFKALGGLDGFYAVRLRKDRKTP